MISFELIYDKNILSDVIKFIGDGFGFTPSLRDAYFVRLKENPDNCPVAAIGKLNNNIAIAILLLHQGTTHDSPIRHIFNVSSWYASPDARGAPSMIFAKMLVDSLKIHILTNYTPSLAARKIFTAFGFKPMHIKKQVLGLTKMAQICFNAEWLPSDRISVKNSSMKESFLKNLHNLKTSQSQISLYNPDHHLYNERKIKKWGFHLKVADIYTTSAQKFALPTVLQIISFMLKNRIVQLNVFYTSSKSNKLEAPPPWLIFGDNAENSYFMPVNSELELH